MDMNINEIVNLGVSVAINGFFIKYFFSEHKKMCDNLTNIVTQLIEMNENVKEVKTEIKEFKKVS